MAKQIADVGFNAVRLWPNHRTFYNTDVKLGETQPSQGFSLHPANKGDGSYLDIFDRFVFQCRQNGLSVYMTALMFYPPFYTEYADIITTTPEDEAAWIEAMDVGALRWSDGTDDAWWTLQYVDERFQAIWLEHARLFLDHVNPYTGIRNADDDNIVMWQLHNEGKFFDKFMLKNWYRVADGNSKTYPAYFQDKLKQKYNAFLIERYADTAGLASSWGNDLLPGESLEDGTVDAGSKDAANNNYGVARKEDFNRFIMSLSSDWNTLFTNHIRAQASDPAHGVAVTSIANDTFSFPGTAEFSVLTEGSMVAFGNYPYAQTGDPTKANYPWYPKLYKTGAWSPYSMSRPADMPAVIYETNYNAFTLFDADLPWMLATFSAWQNINGVFFYFWNAPLNSEMTDGNGNYISPYGQSAFHDRGKEFWGDATFVSAIQAAGEAYLGGLLPTAANPTTVTIDDDLATDPGWNNWSYKGNKTLSLDGLSSATAGNLFNYLNGTAFTKGLRVRITDSPFDISADGSLYKPSFGADYDLGAEVEWRASKGQLTVDTPQLKTFVGFLEPGQDSVSWDSGNFSVTNIVLDATPASLDPFVRPFVAISLTSLDGLPLESSNVSRLTVLSHAYRDGMVQNYYATSGTGPLFIRQVSADLNTPFSANREARFRDFGLETYAQETFTNQLNISPVTFPPGSPVFDIIITNPLAPDQDGDGLNDAQEILLGTNVNNSDSDGDGLSDYDEVIQDSDPNSYLLGTDYNPLLADTDNDGFNDGDELAAGSGPLDASSTPALGDINNDGAINLADVMLMVRIVIGSYEPTLGERVRADVAPLVEQQSEPNGQINAADLLVIFRLIE
ncbi:MAG TPA: hypothetical protein EYO59_03825 [Chromatiaceae bacterium]|nr:hypothetical protein [Chromatiaceae bacterium]